MPETPDQPPPPAWKLADIVDFEFYLTADSGDCRGHEVAHETPKRSEGKSQSLRSWQEPPSIGTRLRPALETLLASPASPEKQRRDAFRLWLEARRGTSDPRRLPGAALDAALRALTTALTILAFLAGAGLVLALLERDTSSINVQLFFATTILLQVALLILLVLGWMFRRALLGAGPVSLLQGAIRAVALRLTAKLDRSGLAAGAMRAFTRSHGRLGARVVFGITQFAGIAFNVGLLAAFFGCLLVLDLNFYWESTFGAKMDATLHRLTELISLPWSWARPEWTPSLADIQVRGAGAGTLGRVTATDPLTWYPFLLCSLVTWGLLPRLLLRGLAGATIRRTLRAPSFHQRHHRELWRRLTAVDLQADAAAPTDGATVLNWNGIEVAPEQLHDQVIRQLRLNPLETFTVGTGTPEADDAALHSLSEHRRSDHSRTSTSNALVVLAESWGLVPKRMQDFHAKTRAHLGRELPLHFLLLGPPSKETPFTPPTPDDVKVWENFLDTLNDPNTDLRPYRD